MPDSDSTPENLRAEYGVIGTSTTAMTTARYQTVAIYLAALGLILSQGTPSQLTLVLILVVSVGLWLMDLRNRDLLLRLGERGTRIEKKAWKGRERKHPTTGGDGFFLDSGVPPRLRLLMADPIAMPGQVSWAVSHAFGIDTVFLGVIGYSIALLAGATSWPWLLVALIPLALGIVVAVVLDRVNPDAVRKRRGRSADPGE
jgi:hypothetical protein